MELIYSIILVAFIGGLIKVLAKVWGKKDENNIGFYVKLWEYRIGFVSSIVFTGIVLFVAYIAGDVVPEIGLFPTTIGGAFLLGIAADEILFRFFKKITTVLND